MRRLSAGQWFELGFWMVFAAVAYGFSFEFDREIEMFRFGASGWPRVIIVLILIAVAGQLLQDLQRGNADPLVDKGIVRPDPNLTKAGSIAALALTLALPILYASLLEYTGYYFTTPLFLAAYLYVTGERRVKWLVVVPLVIYVVLTILFTRILYVGLPVGYWPGFYDFSNWLIVLIRS